MKMLNIYVYLCIIQIYVFVRIYLYYIIYLCIYICILIQILCVHVRICAFTQSKQNNKISTIINFLPFPYSSSNWLVLLFFSYGAFFFLYTLRISDMYPMIYGHLPRFFPPTPLATSPTPLNFSVPLPLPLPHSSDKKLNSLSATHVYSCGATIMVIMSHVIKE